MPARGRRTSRALPIVTLSTDIGWAYAAEMKGVLAAGLDPGRIVDLAHDLAPHRVAEAAFLLRSMASRFPAGTIHVAVVDPGVGGPRAPIVVRCRDGSLLVGPDNGVLAPLADELGSPRAWRIEPARLGSRTRVGTTFEGRDVFAPAAVRLARGMPPGRLGPRVPMRRLRLPEAHRTRHGASGEVLYSDRFGNLITNVPSRWVPRSARRLAVRVADRRPLTLPWVDAYVRLGPGRPGVLASSFGLVEIARREASAAERWRVRPRTAVALDWSGPSRRRARRANG